MRWTTFAIFAFVALALDLGLRPLLALGDAGIRPSFTLILLVYIAMSASPTAVAWAAVILGVLVDLTTPLPFMGQQQSAHLIGPSVLGYLAGGYAALQVRAVIFRQSRLAAPITVLIGGAFVHLVIVAVLTVRGLSFLPATPIAHWEASDELFHRFLALLYSAVLSVPAVALLGRMDWLWGFGHGQRSRRM